MVQPQEKSWLWFQSIARGEQPHSQWGHAWISSEMWCGQNQHLEFTLFLQWLVKVIVINEIIIPLRKNDILGCNPVQMGPQYPLI